MNTIRPQTLWYMAALALLTGILTFTGCAHVRTVLKTIDKLAQDACELFAQDHPQEFGLLVERVAPAQASKSGFNPKVLCTIADVVAPFLEQQQSLQRETAISLQNGNMPDAAAPQ